MSVAQRREREQMMRREVILEAANRLFEEKGYGPTTVDEIATQAELGKGTIYSYFKSKEEIYIALLEKRLSGLKDHIMTTIKASDSAVENLYGLYDIFIRYHNENKDFLDTWLIQTDEQMLTRLGNLADGLRSKFPELVEFIGTVLGKGIARGEFVALDVPKMSRMIIGLLLGVIVESKMGLITEDLVTYRRNAIQFILSGIRKTPALT